jgi:hypothetical protein
MMEQRFSAIAAMVSEIEQAAANQPDPLAVFLALLKIVLASEVDPYLLTGSMVEGIAVAIAKNIPPERQGDVAVGAVALPRDRLRSYGAI